MYDGYLVRADRRGTYELTPDVVEARNLSLSAWVPPITNYTRANECGTATTQPCTRASRTMSSRGEGI